MAGIPSIAAGSPMARRDVDIGFTIGKGEA